MLSALAGINYQILARQGYEIADCQFNLQQGIDAKGQPFTEVHGGTLSLILPMLPPCELLEWSINSRSYKMGTVCNPLPKQ